VIGVRALAHQNFDYPVVTHEGDEFGELTRAFDHMRKSLMAAQQRLLQAEQLATIGRMASSLSYDLRHRLTAILANSEFLVEPSKNLLILDIIDCRSSRDRICCHQKIKTLFLVLFITNQERVENNGSMRPQSRAYQVAAIVSILPSFAARPEHSANVTRRGCTLRSGQTLSADIFQVMIVQP
jgi:signal transduction histidine kinase